MNYQIMDTGRRRRRRRLQEIDGLLFDDLEESSWTTATTTVPTSPPLADSTNTSTTTTAAPSSPLNEEEESVVEEQEIENEASHIVRIDANTRLAQLTAILPLSNWNENKNERELVDFRVYLQVSVYLAWHHLQNPSQAILPQVAQRLEGCDIQFVLDMFDTQFSPLQAAHELVRVLVETQAHVVTKSSSSSTVSNDDSMPIISNVTGTTRYSNNGLTITNTPWTKGDPQYTLLDPSMLPPMAIMGAARSAVTGTLSGLSSVYGIPQISGSSTASILDDKERHPLLARTVPTNAGDARAIVLYLHEALRIQHFAILYIGDDFGTNYHADVVREANARHLSVQSILYTEQSMESALLQLKESGMRFVLAILNPSSWKRLLSRAVHLEVAGPDTGFTWYFTEANLEVANPAFTLDTQNSGQDALVAQALHGAGIVLIHVPDHEPMDQALQDFRQDTVLQRDFEMEHHSTQDADLLQEFSYPPVGRSFYQYLYYDALMALGVAACETTSRDLFTGHELYQQLLKTEFQGVSGQVSFDPLTGTRRAETFGFRIGNLVRDDSRNGDDGIVRFQTQTAAMVHPDENSSEVGANKEIVELMEPFVYADSKTQIPADLSPVVQELNLIPRGARGLGLTLCLLAMISSIVWMLWTLMHRKKDVVRSSQPFFLVQLCLGTLIMASAIIPLSLQEPVHDRVLDMACMAVPWLISIGFVTAFSALFSKTWRINRLFKSGRSCRRVKVVPKDVMLPFVVLLTINLILLVAWSIVAPVTWQRVSVDNFDQHGRIVESIGSCRASEDQRSKVLAFVIPIIAVNIVALVFANYQAYKARKVPTEFFESSYIFMSFASLLETLIIGAPLLFAGSADPTTSFLIRSFVITICCLAIQLPLFVPKYVQRKTVLQERLNGASLTRSAVNVFIDGQQVNMTALTQPSQGQGSSSSSSIPRSLRNVFSNPNQSHSTVEISGISSAAPPTPDIAGRSTVRRTSKYFKEVERKRLRNERRCSTVIGGVGSRHKRTPTSLSVLSEVVEHEQKSQKEQTPRQPQSRHSVLFQNQGCSPDFSEHGPGSKHSLESETSEVDVSAHNSL